MNVDLVQSNADARRHELLADLAEQSARFLSEKHGIDQDVAADIGNSLADFFCDHWHGQSIYMVSDAAFKLSKRDLEIYRRMERGNAMEISRELGISYVRVYQIYKRVLTAMRAKVQPQLFQTPESELSTGEGKAV